MWCKTGRCAADCDTTSE